MLSSHTFFHTLIGTRYNRPLWGIHGIATVKLRKPAEIQYKRNRTKWLFPFSRVWTIESICKLSIPHPCLFKWYIPRTAPQSEQMSRFIHDFQMLGRKGLSVFLKAWCCDETSLVPWWTLAVKCQARDTWVFLGGHQGWATWNTKHFFDFNMESVLCHVFSFNYQWIVCVS